VSPESFQFWVTTAVIPALLFAINIGVRMMRTLPASTSGDWIILLLVVDFTAVSSPVGFRDHVKLSFVHNNLEPTFSVLALIGIILWLFTVLKIEPVLEQGRNEDGWTWKISVVLLFFLSFCIATALTAIHIRIFLGD